jgi:hypothetical protein
MLLLLFLPFFFFFFFFFFGLNKEEMARGWSTMIGGIFGLASFFESFPN